MKTCNILIILIFIGCCTVFAEDALLSPYVEKAIKRAEERFLKARHTYESEVHRAVEKCIEDLEKAKKAETKNGDFESAQAITLLLENIRSGAFLTRFEEKYFSEMFRGDEKGRPVSPVKLNEIKIDGRQKVGFDAGRIDKGQHVILQYVSGKWKGWGGIASENPDAEVQERGDRCRVAIVLDDKVVSVVPFGTTGKPYVYKLKKSGNLTFRINDDDDEWVSNPQGFVTYKFGVR